MSRVLASFVVAIAASLLPATRALAQGCAMCGNSLAPNDPATGAMNASIVFLLLMPYALLASVGGWLYLRYRHSGPRPRGSVIALPWARAAARPGSGPQED